MIYDMFDYDPDEYEEWLENDTGKEFVEKDTYEAMERTIENFNKIANKYSHILLGMNDLMIFYNKV